MSCLDTAHAQIASAFVGGAELLLASTVVSSPCANAGEERWAAAAVGLLLPFREVLLTFTRQKATILISGLKKKKNMLPSFESNTLALDLRLCVLSLLF